MAIYGKYMENRWEIDEKCGDLWKIESCGYSNNKPPIFDGSYHP